MIGGMSGYGGYGGMSGYGGYGGMSGYGGMGGYGGYGGMGGGMWGPGMFGLGGAMTGMPYGAAGALLGGQPRMTPAMAAMHSAQEQLSYFISQGHQYGLPGEALAAVERDLDQMRSVGNNQPTVRLQALQTAMTDLATLGRFQDMPTEGRAYLQGLQERLQELAQVAGGNQDTLQ
jgi:hypothetical protein